MHMYFLKKPHTTLHICVLFYLFKPGRNASLLGEKVADACAYPRLISWVLIDVTDSLRIRKANY